MGLQAVQQGEYPHLKIFFEGIEWKLDPDRGCRFEKCITPVGVDSEDQSVRKN